MRDGILIWPSPRTLLVCNGKNFDSLKSKSSLLRTMYLNFDFKQFKVLRRTVELVRHLNRKYKIKIICGCFRYQVCLQFVWQRQQWVHWRRRAENGPTDPEAEPHGQGCRGYDSRTGQKRWVYRIYNSAARKTTVNSASSNVHV